MPNGTADEDVSRALTASGRAVDRPLAATGRVSASGL